MTPSHPRRLVAAMLTAAIVAALTIAPVQAAGSASFGGRVLQQDGVTPRSDVVVHLVDARGETGARSVPTTDEGAFRIAQATPGTYSVLVDTGDGAFISPTPVTLKSGPNPALALSLGGGSPNFYQQQTGLGGGKALSAAWKWSIVGAISVGALFVVNELSDEEDEPASPF